MKKSLLAAAVLGFLASCTSPLDFKPAADRGLEAQTRGLTSSANPVAFYKEAKTGMFVYSGLPGTIITYYIVVADLAYDKKVNIRFETADGTWKDYPASFVQDLPQGQELWRLDTAQGNTYGYYGYVGLGKKFAVNYTVAGKTYWDNNQGQNYTEQGAFLRTGTQISLTSGYANSTYTGEILVRNLAPSKKVNLVYTLDRWATTQVAPATFLNTVTGTDLETWNFTLPYTHGQTLEFALAYDVNGTTYWDNNFGSNYLYNGR